MLGVEAVLLEIVGSKARCPNISLAHSFLDIVNMLNDII